MRKTILIISALALGASLAFAATPAQTCMTLKTAYDDIYADGQAKIRKARASDDRAAIRAAGLENKAAIQSWRAGNIAALDALVSDVEDIGEVNPGLATWLIKTVLGHRNTDAEGNLAKVFDQNDADRLLASKLLVLSKGSQSYYYIQYYATANELAALEGSDSTAVFAAALKRANDLGIYADFLPAWNQKHLGKGQLSATYVRWFNQQVRNILAPNTDAARKEAIDYLLAEFNGVISLGGSTPSITQRRDKLREQIDAIQERLTNAKK
ncbi:hypothetical protein [Geminisphaera colitermitum]|uniref:hypothetical protein n=1 Tax=Geminisphaera colitermitum TaxID=1148786 RepID=UPI000158C9B1|nr:hypothetical protein [Geminisphaera colitermitum]